MGLCAPSHLKPVYNKRLGLWFVGDMAIPNYSPDSCKLNFKKEDKMLDEDQNKIVVDQLTDKREKLEAQIESLTRQSAMIGKKLFECLEELSKIDDVLDSLTDDEDEE